MMIIFHKHLLSQTLPLQQMSTSSGLARFQRGVVYGGVALGVVALSGMAAVTADWTAQQSALALQQQQGKVLSTINEAVGSYMTLQFPALTGQDVNGAPSIPDACAELSLRHDTSVAASDAIKQNKCEMEIPLAVGSYKVSNAFQPTVADLKALGLLDAGISSGLLLDSDAVVAKPDGSGLPSRALADKGYVIVIKPVCIGVGSGAAVCSKGNKALQSMLMNAQPFSMGSKYTQHFMPLLMAAGPDSSISGPPDASNVLEQSQRLNPEGEFRSWSQGWSKPNPITQRWTVTSGGSSTSYTRGVDGIVMMRNGYDSAYWQMTRRDGSSPPTANWDFNGKDLTNVGKLTAASAEISGDVKVGGNQSVAGNQIISGSQNVEGSGSFKGLLSALGDLLVKGATELQGKLTVAGPALFKDSVTLEKNLAVKGDAQIDGVLKGSTAEFTGALTAQSLRIGSTLIGPGGALLGASTGWGVTPATACSTDKALAQSADGKLMICRSSAWAPLITSENIVITAPAISESCSPEGAPGRLPDGTLAVCKDGKWSSTAQGNATPGASCATAGALASTNENGRIVVLGCRDGKWTQDVFVKPRLGYATDGYSCGLEDELALDGRGYPSLLVCKNGLWQPPGTQLLTNMQLGTSCTLEGVLASDIERTGLLVCKKGVWSKITEPVHLGGSCADDGRVINLTGGGKLYCVSGAWFDMPDTINLTRIDGMRVVLNRLVKFNGENYYIYNELGTGRLNKSQSYSAIAHLLWGDNSTWDWGVNGPETVYANKRNSAYRNPDLAWRDDSGGLYVVTVPTVAEFFQITDAYGGRPPAWNFEFQDGSEVWTATRRDECDNWGCASKPWNGGVANWWDHVTVDLWNKQIFHRWNSDQRAVILKLKKMN